MLNFRKAAWATVVALALPLASAATVVKGQTFEQMTRDAQVILRATVGAQQAGWDDAGRRIHTWTELKVLEILKGEAPPLFLVRQPGGEVGRIGSRVSGAARFEPGEEVLLFLEAPADDPATFIVRGMAAGKVRLGEDALGRRRATRDLRGLAFWTPGEEPVVRELGGVEDLGEAQAFVQRIRLAVSRAVGVAR